MVESMIEDPVKVFWDESIEMWKDKYQVDLFKYKIPVPKIPRGAQPKKKLSRKKRRNA